MGAFNAVINGLFNLIFRPMQGFHPLGAIAIVSLLAGILMLWLFGKVSDQKSIRVLRDRIRGNLMGVRLFGDDPRILMKLQGRLLWDNLVYLKYALIPMVVLIVPVALIIVQLHLRFEDRPMRPGEAAVVKVKVRDAGNVAKGVDLAVPEGVTIETPAVRIASVGEVAWRIRAEEPGSYDLTVRSGGEAVEKRLVVGERWSVTSGLRTGSGFFSKLLHPGEKPIPGSSAIESIEVGYERLALGLFGWNLHWLFVFFVLSLVSGFAFRRVLGVEI